MKYRTQGLRTNAKQLKVVLYVLNLKAPLVIVALQKTLIDGPR